MSRIVHDEHGVTIVLVTATGSRRLELTDDELVELRNLLQAPEAPRDVAARAEAAVVRALAAFIQAQMGAAGSPDGAGGAGGLSTVGAMRRAVAAAIDPAAPIDPVYLAIAREQVRRG